jgi:hypothetical protein
MTTWVCCHHHHPRRRPQLHEEKAIMTCCLGSKGASTGSPSGSSTATSTFETTPDGALAPILGVADDNGVERPRKPRRLPTPPPASFMREKGVRLGAPPF